MNKQKILVIEDDLDICQLLRRFLSKHGYEVFMAHNGKQGISIATDNKPDLILCDFRLGDLDGFEVLRAVKDLYPSMPFIIITGYSDVRVAVNIMRMGALDYITKPLFPDEILLTIRKALEGKPEEPELNGHPASVKQKPAFTATPETFIFGDSPRSRALLKQIELIAPTNYSVIVYGESGSGKEAVAQAIHMKSPRAAQPFVAMDCGAISKELANSELFGHEKGSFTGALNTKIGHFEMANGGTLFLDEVANLPYEVQASLLRVVQERRVKRIGSTKEINLDVRILVASNENLAEAYRKGRFREDLFHRFNEFHIEVPPLRDRGEDIGLYARHFIVQANSELGKNIRDLDEEVMEVFTSYPWYGNLRELRNVIKRAALLTEGDTIRIKALPFEIANFRKLQFPETSTETLSPEERAKQEPLNLKSAALEAEYEMILKVLRQVNFNKSKAAKILNIDRKTLYNKMKSYNM
jgi:two-component system, NtrC family, response regulator HydG